LAIFKTFGKVGNKATTGNKTTNKTTTFGKVGRLEIKQQHLARNKVAKARTR
jgi:hypothetical protein